MKKSLLLSILVLSVSMSLFSAFGGSRRILHRSLPGMHKAHLTGFEYAGIAAISGLVSGAVGFCVDYKNIQRDAYQNKRLHHMRQKDAQHINDVENRLDALLGLMKYKQDNHEEKLHHLGIEIEQVDDFYNGEIRYLKEQIECLKDRNKKELIPNKLDCDDSEGPVTDLTDSKVEDLSQGSFASYPLGLLQRARVRQKSIEDAKDLNN